MTTDADRLRHIRGRLDPVGAAHWSPVFVDDQRHIEAENADGRCVILHADRHCSDDEFFLAASAAQDMRFLIQLIDRAGVRVRRLQADLQNAICAGRNYAAEAAIKLRQADFQAYLQQLVPAIDAAGSDRLEPAAAADQRLKSLLEIDSKKQLNADLAAANAWRDLVRRFDAWQRDRQKTEGVT